MSARSAPKRRDLMNTARYISQGSQKTASARSACDRAKNTVAPIACGTLVGVSAQIVTGTTQRIDTALVHVSSLEAYRPTTLKKGRQSCRLMGLPTDDRIPMAVWCPLILPEDQDKMGISEEDLVSINHAYTDWLASMRGRSFADAGAGVLLDRFRMLMINIGVSCSQSRELAETVQSLLSEHLRTRTLKLVTTLPDSSEAMKIIKRTLERFFQALRFTRDIDPLDEMLKAASGVTLSAGSGAAQDGSIAVDSLRECAVVLRRLYERFISPDPWGEY